MKSVTKSEWLRTPDDYRRGDPEVETAELLLYSTEKADNVWTPVTVVADSVGGAR